VIAGVLKKVSGAVSVRTRQERIEADIEVWGGVECTVNRVNDHYIDQFDRSGHTTRLTDLDRFCDLGLSALRHAVIWERTAPRGLDCADWRWPDKSLSRIRHLGMRPIVGLVHHGSGPIATNLLDPQFPYKLAEYAAAVAVRYPWVDEYTPVNEPLTTARFSGLYGHWYPHARDDLSFSRALLNQCRGVVLSMRAIRQVNSSARLLQTEDVGKVFSTSKLAYQADFENERRWCTFDLLAGVVDRQHPMWSYFQWAGVGASELEWVLDNPSPPDLIGVNHYLSSERYLDEHINRYPNETWGGNGRDRYSDVLAARVLENGASGHESLLWEVWNRYRLPVAVTECHNGSTREEQMRWLLEVWHGCDAARARGADVVAITPWSLLGAFDWNHLVTRDEGYYESGVFDIRSPVPRTTALARLIGDLGSKRQRTHPVLAVPGWWKRPKRFVYGFALDQSGHEVPIPFQNKIKSRSIGSARPLLIAGEPGTLASAFARICDARGIHYNHLSREEFDIADAPLVRHRIRQLRPWCLVNAAGYGDVDLAETDRDRCYRENSEGPTVLARECAGRSIQLLTFSTPLVFNGSSPRPYVESDRTDALNYFGRTKVEAEHRIQSIMPFALIGRSSSFFDPWQQDNFITKALRALAGNAEFCAADDVFVSPTYLPDLVNNSLDLLIDGESGIWHLANAGRASWADFVEKVAIEARISTTTLRRCRLEDLNLAAQRPINTVLGSERAQLMPTLEEAISHFVQEVNFAESYRWLDTESSFTNIRTDVLNEAIGS
jgi:dTDP-4-dehydrorhamnose reductase